MICLFFICLFYSILKGLTLLPGASGDFDSWIVCVKNGVILDDARFFQREILLSSAGRIWTGRLASIRVEDDSRVDFRIGGMASLCPEGSFSGFSTESWRVYQDPPSTPWRALNSSAGIPSC